jgi:hypothetical protein
MMSSSGCRIGSIPTLTVKNLRFHDEYQLYQITFYENTKEEYFSFCSPECSKYILDYLQFRERSGEKIKPDSPLIRDDFITGNLLRIANPRPLGLGAYVMHLREILVKVGLRKITPIITSESTTDTAGWKRQRKEIAQNHGFRKFVHTTMANAKINIEIREMLLGHSIGLGDAYYRPTLEQCLLEYLKVVNDLTINEENRLSQRIKELQENNQDKDYIIQGKLSEKDEQIKALQDSIKFLSDTVNRALLADPENKIITAPESDGMGIIKAIALAPEIKNTAVGKVQISPNNKKK